MKFPSTERLVRAFKRGWATASQMFDHMGKTENNDTLIHSGIAQVLREIQDFQIPPATQDGVEHVTIQARDRIGNAVYVKVAITGGKMSVLQTMPELPTQYDMREVGIENGKFYERAKTDDWPLKINNEFQSLLSNLDVPENRFGNICNCRIEMASFRDVGAKCPHCGKTITVLT